MPTLWFPDLWTLRQVLELGVIPRSVSQSPVIIQVDAGGRHELTPALPIPDEVIWRVLQLGAKLRSRNANSNEGKRLACWQSIIPLDPSPGPGPSLGSTFLFALPGSDLTSLACEIGRLSTQRIALAWPADESQDDSTDERIWLRITSPPAYTTARVMESGRAHGYVQAAERVWVAAGYQHPLIEQVVVPAGKTLFLNPTCVWEMVDDRPWMEPVPAFLLAASVQPQLTSSIREKERPEEKISSRLRLVRTSDYEDPELWLVSVNALAGLTELVKNSDERTLSHLIFAVFSGESGPTVLLRTRKNDKRTHLAIPGVMGFKPVLKLPNLMIPCDRRLQPALRRDALHRLLAPDGGRLTWLRVLEDDSFRPESVPVTAFRPLSEWIGYGMDAALQARTCWVQSTDWSFERFSVAPMSAIPAAASEASPNPVVRTETASESTVTKGGLLGRVLNWLKPRKTESSPSEGELPPAPPASTAVTTSEGAAPERPSPSGARATEIRRRCEELEKRLLKELPQLTREQRLESWAELAAIYGQLNNSIDAAICWINALWEQEKLSTLSAWGWLRAEATQARWKPAAADLPAMRMSPHTPEKTRTSAAFVVWANLQEPTALRASRGDLQNHLDEHESHLSIRAAWLAKSILAHGDILALARTRDRLLDRLRSSGLAADRDLPAFLQFNESGAGSRLQQVRKWLRERQDFLHRWINSLAEVRDDSPAVPAHLQSVGLQPDIVHTCAYADLMLAWGLARLRFTEDVDPLVESARQKLPKDDPVHQLLLEGFAFRIGLAREGQAQNQSFPAAWLVRLEQLPTLARYRVDKLRQHSGILDSSVGWQAYESTTFCHFAGWDELRKQLFKLAAQSAFELNAQFEKLLDSPSSDPAAHALILSQGINHLDRLAPALADRLGERIAPALDRVAGNLRDQLPLLEHAFRLAAHLNNKALAQSLLRQFSRLLDEVHAIEKLRAIDTLTGQAIDCLRQVGLSSEIDRFAGQVHKWMLRGHPFSQARIAQARQWPTILRTCTHIAAGWNACGKEDEAHAMMEEIRSELYGVGLSSWDRTTLAMTYARRLGELSFRVALGRFEEMFQRLHGISLSGTTNSHYTLRPLQLIDVIIRGIVHHNFALAPAIRSWLMDDEQRVRERILKDFAEIMRQQ